MPRRAARSAIALAALVTLACAGSDDVLGPLAVTPGNLSHHWALDVIELVEVGDPSSRCCTRREDEILSFGEDGIARSIVLRAPELPSGLFGAGGLRSRQGLSLSPAFEGEFQVRGDTVTLPFAYDRERRFLVSLPSPYELELHGLQIEYTNVDGDNTLERRVRVRRYQRAIAVVARGRPDGGGIEFLPNR